MYKEGLESRIEITIDRKERRVGILDHGPGLSYEECLENLLPVAHSKKTIGTHRGFRGIGRLSALSFAGSVSFLTRKCGSELVTRVVWSGSDLVGRNNPSALTFEDILGCVRVDTVSGDNYPEHFFRVEIGQVNRQAAGAILNRDIVRAYISEVCPVPMDLAFPFAQDVQSLFDSGHAPYTQEIVFCDDREPLCRQYGAAIQLLEGREDHFEEFEAIRIPDLEGSQLAAVGWVAHSSYRGALPKALGIRGIRARMGNIQIGDEAVFDHLLTETRFNRWCVGELHVLDARIVPNARRDYFEPNPHLRNLENHLGPVFRRIAARCRTSSSTRNRLGKILSDLERLEEMCGLMEAGYLAADERENLAQVAEIQVKMVRESLCLTPEFGVYKERLDRVKLRIKDWECCRDFTLLRAVDSEELRSLRKMIIAVIEESGSPALAKRIIERFLSQGQTP